MWVGRGMDREEVLFLSYRLFWPSEGLGWKNQVVKRNQGSWVHQVRERVRKRTAFGNGGAWN